MPKIKLKIFILKTFVHLLICFESVVFGQLKETIMSVFVCVINTCKKVKLFSKIYVQSERFSMAYAYSARLT